MSPLRIHNAHVVPCRPVACAPPRRAFTLVELLIVTAIISLIAAMALVNFRLAVERALKSADAANLHTIATALQHYYVDYNTLPPADRTAGPFVSHTEADKNVGNGPAAGGSWDGLPWILHEARYLTDWRTLFNPKYLRLYEGGETIAGGHPRYHNFRYAYNAAALSSGGLRGGIGNIMQGDTWIVRNLWIGPQHGWYGSSYPDYPADYQYPWGEGELRGRLEHVLYGDLAVRTVFGGADEPAP